MCCPSITSLSRTWEHRPVQAALRSRASGRGRYERMEESGARDAGRPAQDSALLAGSEVLAVVDDSAEESLKWLRALRERAPSAPGQTYCFARALRSAAGEWSVVDENDNALPVAQVRHAVVWRDGSGALAAMPSLGTVFAMGAGADAVLKREDLPESVDVVKLQDAGMAQQMVEYAMWAVLRFQRNFDVYARQQGTRSWVKHCYTRRRDVCVAVLGLGALGSHVARSLSAFGYTVMGWSRRGAPVQGVEVHSSLSALREHVLPRCNVLVNLLPHTNATHHILGHDALSLLPRGAHVVNMGRGATMDTDALLSLLDSQQLGGAVLDVYEEEPLPASHRLWAHERAVVTPHIAADTLIDEAAGQITANLERRARGEAMIGVVDRALQY